MSPDPGLPRSPAGSFNPWMIVVMLSVVPFMEVLDTTIANVSLTHIAGSLGASPEQSTWILTSYLVSNSVVIPISGWLAQVLGRKRFYLICVAVFTISSVACAFSTTLGMILLARIFQGLGGGGLAPVTQSMLADSFPPEKRSQVFAVYAVTIIVAPVMGPTVGGWITDNLTWHWIFLINLPVGLAAFAMITVFITEPPLLLAERAALLKKGLKLDYLGLALVAAGFGFLQIFLDKFQEDDGFSSPFIVTLFCIWVVCLSLLVVWEWNHPQPVMNFRLFLIRNFAIGNIVMFLVGFILLSSSQLLPQLVQTLMGYDSETAGMVMASGGVFSLFVMPIAGLLTGRVIPPRLVMAFGLICLGLAFILQSRIFTLDASFTTIAVLRVLQALPLPFLFVPVSAACYVGVPPQNNGEASALMNQTRNIGSSVGISFVTAMLAWRTQFHHARLAESITPYSSLHGMSIPQINQMVQQQASFMSYLDLFHIVGLMALLAWPVALLLKSPPRKAAQGVTIGP